MSERPACRVIGCERMTIRHRCRRPDDARLRERLVGLARERRRFGYRRLLIFLRKRALGSRMPMPVPAPSRRGVAKPLPWRF